jgi:hypothetical protein
MKNNKGLLTIGSVVGFVIISSYAIRSYLDLLRIKRLKQEIKVNKEKE